MNNVNTLYQNMTEQIIEAIEQKPRRSPLPWHPAPGEVNSIPVNAVTGKSYRGGNVLTLWLTAMRKGYRSSTWATLRQWNQLGARVRKGESSTPILFWSTIRGIEEPELEDEKLHQFARTYHVFHADQVEGYRPKEIPLLPEAERIEHAEDFFSSLGADIRHSPNEAYYNVEEDFISLPGFSLFRDAARYYATLAHEVMHWSGARHRLNRPLSTNPRALPYATEELVADLGSAFLCASLGLPSTSKEETASYLASWLFRLKADKRAILSAAAEAQRATDYLHSVYAVQKIKERIDARERAA